MKKCLPRTHPKTQLDRFIDSICAAVNKYPKVERNKKLPEGFDFWDFVCRVVISAKFAQPDHVSALPKEIGDTRGTSGDFCYVQILAKPKKCIRKLHY